MLKVCALKLEYLIIQNNGSDEGTMNYSLQYDFYL